MADFNQTLELTDNRHISALINLTIGDRAAYLQDLNTAENLYREVGDEAGLTQIERVREFDY